MRISLEMLPKKKLLHLFDLAAKTHKNFLAAQVVKELAKKNHLTIDDQLRKLGQQANERKCVASFQKVSELWKKRATDGGWCRDVRTTTIPKKSD